jgi:hypothetical protein
MTNVTLPDEDKLNQRGFGQGWIMSDKKAHQAMWQLGVKAPMALAVLHFITSRMNRGTNSVIMSFEAMSSLIGVTQPTVKTAVKVLSEGKFIQILKSGKSNVYVVNHQVAWQGSRGARYAHFGAELIVHEKEQNKSVDELIEDSKALQKIPVIHFDERVYVQNEVLDPPDQQEMDLP